MHYEGMMTCHMLVKAFLLVVVSFFTLLGVSKTDSKKLKKFGRILVAIMWGLAIGIVLTALYMSLTGKRCMFS